jgi:hypothetical protein
MRLDALTRARQHQYGRQIAGSANADCNKQKRPIMLSVIQEISRIIVTTSRHHFTLSLTPELEKPLQF